jgi:hypothetical protein
MLSISFAGAAGAGAVAGRAVLVAEEASKNATPNPLLMGLTAGVVLLLLLIVVSRFNKDR